MKVTKIDTIPLRVPLERTIQMSIGSVFEVDHVVVIIETDNGIHGCGETASEYGPIFSEEFQDSIRACIDNYIAPSMIGENPLNQESISEKMNRAARARAVDTPIMVDESLFRPEDAINCIRAGAAEIFSIKISYSGGLLRAKRIAAISQAAGVPCYLGGMAEMGIGAAAALQFAASTPILTYGCEVKPNCAKDIVIPNIKVENGYIFVPEGPVLGFDIDEKILTDYVIH